MIDSQYNKYAWEEDKKYHLTSFRDHFIIPTHDKRKEMIYFCGHSLGLQPKATRNHLQAILDRWGQDAISGYFNGEFPWLSYTDDLREKLSPLVGASASEVVIMNSLSVNLHLMMVSFYRPQGAKYKIVLEEDAFPSDHYVVESQVKYHGFDYDDAVIKLESGSSSLSEEPWCRIIEERSDDIAMILLPGVQYLTGKFFDIEKIAHLAKTKGITVGLDLAHAVGNVPLQLHDSGADFAVWCHYKYLNSGPAAVGGCFIHEKHTKNSQLHRFAGWWGHNKETRFLMRPGFDPILSAEAWQCSNSPILACAGLRASLEIFNKAGGIDELRNKSIRMTSFLKQLLDTQLRDEVEVLTSHNPQERGAQLSLVLTNSQLEGRKLVEQLYAQGVVVDWREPNVMRVAPTPLYNTFMEIYDFVSILKQTLSRWK